MNQPHPQHSLENRGKLPECVGQVQQPNSTVDLAGGIRRLLGEGVPRQALQTAMERGRYSSLLAQIARAKTRKVEAEFGSLGAIVVFVGLACVGRLVGWLVGWLVGRPAA